MNELLEKLKIVKNEIKTVAQSLENTMHQMPVEGAKVDGISLEKVLNEHINRIEKLKPVPKVEETKKDLIENLEKLSKNLEISKESSVKCQESLKNLRTETLRKKSYEISQKQVEELVNVDDLIQSVMSIPPEPKLIDF